VCTPDQAQRDRKSFEEAAAARLRESEARREIKMRSFRRRCRRCIFFRLCTLAQGGGWNRTAYLLCIDCSIFLLCICTAEIFLLGECERKIASAPGSRFRILFDFQCLQFCCCFICYRITLHSSERLSSL
jgi:hypothetical protein